MEVEKKKSKKTQISNEKYSHFDALSDELITEILIRVTLKSLYISRSVCQKWRHLTTNPFFIKTFTLRTKTLPPILTGFFYNTNHETQSYSEVKFLSLQETNHGGGEFIDKNLTFLQRSVFVLSSNNGVLLCVEKNPLCACYIVCNPYTRQLLALPKPQYHRNYHRRYTFLVFQESGFKIVCVRVVHVNVLVVDVYCSEFGEWIHLEFFHEMGLFDPRKNFVLFDGSVYLWDLSNRLLCLFDLEGRGLSFLGLPTYRNPRRVYLGVPGGCFYYAEADLSRFYVWVLVDGVDWCLKYSVEYGSLVDMFVEGSSGSDYLFCSLAFHPSDPEILLLRLRSLKECGVKGILYHMDTEKTELIDNFDTKFTADVVFAYSLPAWTPCLRDTQ